MTTAIAPSEYSSFLDIDRQLATREALFVRNTTSSPASILVINYPSLEGARAFNVPRTSIPFNICDYVDPDALRTSESFRRMLNYQKLVVVPEAQARGELADPERQKAFRAAFDEANNTYRARAGEAAKARAANSSSKDEQQRAQAQGMKNIITAMDPTLAKSLNLIGSDGQAPAPRLIESTNAMHSRLVALDNRVKSGSLAEGQIIDELSLMLGDLTASDLAAVAANPHWPVAAQAWARERVSFMTRAKVNP